MATAHVHRRRHPFQRRTIAAAATALYRRRVVCAALALSLALAPAPTLALALAGAGIATDGLCGRARRIGVPSLEGARRPALDRLVRLPQGEVTEERSPGVVCSGAEPALEGLQ